MSKIKNRWYAALGLIFAFVLCFSFAFVTQKKVSAAAADVEVTLSSWDNLTKETETVNGVSMTSYGNIVGGWGGWLKYAVVSGDSGVDVSEIAATNKGAFSFWLYIADEKTRAAYAEISSWNIDVCSAASYNDTNKYSFNVASAKSTVFKNLRLGWQEIVLPFSAAEEKNAIDWSTVRHFRFNQSGLGGGENNIKVGGFKFTTTDLTAYTILEGPAVTFNHKDPVSGVDTAEMNIPDVGDVTAYYHKDKGGFLSVLELDKTYSIDVVPSSALSVWVYFDREEDIDALSSYNIDISSGSSYSDSHKYSFQLHTMFEKCSVGWNQVILPLANANEKNNMDWSDVNYIRLNVGGGKACRVGTAHFQIIQSKYAENTVVGYVPPVIDEKPENVRIPCDADTGLHLDALEEGWGDGAVITANGYYKQGSGAWKLTGQGTTGFTKKLANSYDLTDYDYISFWLYVDNAAKLAAMADGQIELRSANDDDHELNWGFKSVASNLHDGWNFITLNMEDGNASTAFDVTAVQYIRIYFVGLPQICTTIFDDLHAHKDAAGTVIESFANGWDSYVQTVGGHDGGIATNMSGQGWQNRKKIKEPIDIADYDMITMWIYCDATAAREIAGTEMELSSSGQCDVNELAFFFPNDLKVGWNHVKFNLADGKKTGGDIDLTKVNFLGFIKTGLPQVTVYFEDLRAVESSTFAEPVVPVEKTTVVSADAAGAFTDTVLSNEEYMEGTGAAIAGNVGGSGTFKATFANPVDTGLALNELGLAFWFYTGDKTALNKLSVKLESIEGFSLEWTVNSVSENGWNWLTFRANEATRGAGVFDPSDVRSITIDYLGDSTKPVTLGFDCVQLVDVNAEGAFDEVRDKRELEPIESVVLDNAESAWSGAGYTEENKKQGYGAVLLEGDAVTATKAVSVGKTDLLITTPRSNNELGVTAWIYVEDVEALDSLRFRLASSENAYIEWTLSSLENGWNWVTLRAANASVTGAVDADGLTSVSLIAAGNGFTVIIDRVSLVNYTVASVLAQPADEGISRNPIQEKVIINCNSAGGTIFSGNMIDTEDMRYGTGCVTTQGAGYQLVAKGLNIGKTELTKDTIVLAFWLWIDDPEKYAGKWDGQIELTSSNQFDKNEISWDATKYFKDLNEGWNWVVLKGTDAKYEGGAPDFDNLNYFRLYVNNVPTTRAKIDRVTVGYIGNTALFTEPDWENEISGSGSSGFIGENASESKGSPYLDWDETEAEGYTYTVTETVDKYVETVSTALVVSLSVVGGAAVAAAVAVAVIFVLKKKKQS